MKCEGTRAETRFRLSAKRTSPFKSAEASVQSTNGSRGVRIGGSNAGYNIFRGSVKSTGYPIHSPVSPSLPLPCVTVYHHVSSGLYHVLQEWKFSGWQVAVLFGRMAPTLGESSLWNLFYITVLESRISRWFLDFLESLFPLIYCNVRLLHILPTQYLEFSHFVVKKHVLSLR